MSEYLIKGGRLVDPANKIEKTADLLLRDGVIAAVGTEAAAKAGKEARVIKARGMVVAPGFVDLHCHLREPGYEEKETVATGSRAAVAGGFTSICCMPNTEPTLDNRATLDFVQAKAHEADLARVYCVAAVSKGRAGAELVEMAELAEAGAVAFSDDGEAVATTVLMRNALTYARMLNRPIMDHCEDARLVKDGYMNEGAVATRLGLRGRPTVAEDIIVSRDIALAEYTGGWVHIQHLSSGRSLQLVRAAKARGVRVTAEVTPHHLLWSEDLVAGRWHDYGEPARQHEPYDTNTKVNPPLRSRDDVEQLLEGLRDGTIDAIATDHAPHDIVDKECEYGFAASGLVGLETALPQLLTLVAAGKLSLSTVISRLTIDPARLLGLPHGTLAPGAAADVVIFDPKRQWQVMEEALFSLGKNTPLLGETVSGQVLYTWRDGNLVHEAAPAGKG